MLAKEFLVKLNSQLENELNDSKWFEKTDEVQKVGGIKITAFDEQTFDDMSNMIGIDPETELLNVLKYELEASIIQKIINDMRSKATTLTVVDLDIDGVKDIVEFVNDGEAIIASPTMVALLERSGSFTIDNADVTINSNSIGISNVGTINNSIVYRDTLTRDEYVMWVNWDGVTPFVKCNIGNSILKQDGKDTVVIDVTSTEIDYSALKPKLFKCFLSKELGKHIGKCLYGADEKTFTY